jgi:hypothetical protein
MLIARRSSSAALVSTSYKRAKSMIQVRNSFVSFFIFVTLIICGGCSSAPSPEVERFLAKQGFDAEFSNPAVTSWEAKTFNLLKKEEWETKSRAEVPNWKGAYYRFTVVKESYQSHQEASDRLNRVHEKPPGLGPDEDKAFPLRAGFNFENTVYVVSCQVSMFHEHLKDFTQELEREVSGAGKRP